MRQIRFQKTGSRNKVSSPFYKAADAWRPALFLLSALCSLIWARPYAAAPWSGILPDGSAIDWSTAGIPGGIPIRTTICATISASSYGNGTSDATAGIQSALNSCSAGVVALGPGTFLLNGVLSIPGNITLRGQGADQTVLNIKSTSGSAAITMGSWTIPWDMSSNVSITGGAGTGSQSIVVSNASGITVGSDLLITELNDNRFVSIAGDEGSCTWCGPFNDHGSRVLGQVSEVTSVNGNTIGINPGLFRSMSNPLPGWSPSTSYPLNAFINPATQPTHSYQQTVENGAAPYTCSSGGSAPAFPINGTSVADGTCSWLDIGQTTTTLPWAAPFSPTRYAGIENLQVYANNTGAGASIAMTECAYCWVSGVENNYTDGDHVEVTAGYHDAIVSSYFSNAFLHTPGAFDSDIVLRTDSTGVLVQNNIIERNHVSVMLEWGAAGNVIAYNYMFGNFGNPPAHALFGTYSMHGAHPEFNLSEGNIGDTYSPDGIWGSNSHNTSFREWQKGTTKICTPYSGRGPVSCTPMGAGAGQGVNGFWATQQIWPFGLGIDSSFYNLVGGILGSQDMANLTIYNGGTPMPQINEVVAQCGPAPCGPGSRSYDAAASALALGYWQADDGSSLYGSSTSYTTLFEHGEFTSPSGAETWSGSITHSLPASFYLDSKPSWFGSVPFPPIGPDVNGGQANAYGHAYAIPSEVCYERVMGGTDGTGSPLKFNADACYGAGGGGGGGSGNAPVINSATNATGAARTAFSYQITATNSPTSFNASGLPSGLTVDTASGFISGTPTSASTDTVTLSATNSSGTGTATLNLTIAASADLSNILVYPNPWRSDKHGNLQITFANLTVNTTVKIFTVSGHWVKTLPTSNTSVTWDLMTDSGDKAASGIYIYLITTADGQKTKGKLAIIR